MSPLCREPTTFSASLRQHFTLYQEVSPSCHSPVALRAMANGEAARQQMAPDPEFDEDVEYAEGPEDYGNQPGDEGFDGGADAGQAPVGGSADPLTAPAEPRYPGQEEPAEDIVLATV
jgi:hypothetical protein